MLLYRKCTAVYLVINFCSIVIGSPVNDNSGTTDKPWHGDWFPVSPGIPDTNPVVNEPEISLHDVKHGIKMGVRNSKCDDGLTNLTVDWNGSAEDYICFESKQDYMPDSNTNPISFCDHIPKEYWAMHECMNSTIEYDDPVPTYGTHRPLWVRYGEYKYLPKQRWLHNLEHGAVVMLYHPCANQHQVDKLKTIVENCLYRHVITPYNQLQPERPLALLTWGCRLSMSVVSTEVVTSFIKMHALKGPEKVSRDGQFDQELIKPAAYVTDQNDNQICPESP